ncbi:MAG: hypothetical protein V1798_05635 [Pseudomonadota bacterium]
MLEMPPRVLSIFIILVTGSFGCGSAGSPAHVSDTNVDFSQNLPTSVRTDDSSGAAFPAEGTSLDDNAKAAELRLMLPQAVGPDGAFLGGILMKGQTVSNHVLAQLYDKWILIPPDYRFLRGILFASGGQASCGGQSLFDRRLIVLNTLGCTRDENVAYIFVHENGHLIEHFGIPMTGVLNTYKDICFDQKAGSCFVDKFRCFLPRGDLCDFNLPYYIPGGMVETPPCSKTASLAECGVEDFANHFVHFMFLGDQFRGVAREKSGLGMSALQEKYVFLRDRIFAGMEF